MANRLAELMDMQDKGARLARNVLTRAFRDMLTELGIDHPRLNVLTEIFLQDPSRQIDLKDTNKLANDRGNLKKEIEKDEYTIKVFMKLMRLLRPKDFKMNFQATWHDGKQLGNGKGLTYTIDLDLEDPEIDKIFEEMDSVERERVEKQANSFITTLQMDKNLPPSANDEEQLAA